MLTLKQIEEGRLLRTIDSASGSACDSDIWETWLRVHAAALLDAAETVARQKAYTDAPDGYDSGACECQGGPFVNVGCPLCVDVDPR